MFESSIKSDMVVIWHGAFVSHLKSLRFHFLISFICEQKLHLILLSVSNAHGTKQKLLSARNM